MAEQPPYRGGHDEGHHGPPFRGGHEEGHHGPQAVPPSNGRVPVWLIVVAIVVALALFYVLGHHVTGLGGPGLH